MTRSEESTEQPAQSVQPTQRSWEKTPDAAWTFWRKGVVPAFALVGVLAYGIGAFAHKTEDQIRLEVADHLARHELTWVRASVSGQQVTLSGPAPSLEARKTALDVVKNVHCMTWLGRLPCATSVSDHFTEQTRDAKAESLTAAGDDPSRTDGKAPPAAPSPDSQATGAPAAKDPAAKDPASKDPAAEEGTQPEAENPTAAASTQAVATGLAPSLSGLELKVVRRDNTVSLQGFVASEQDRSALKSLARTHFPSATLDVQLNVASAHSAPEWAQATGYALELAARCEQGIIALRGNTLDVDCESQTASAKDALNTVLAKRPVPLSDGEINVLALDEVKVCESALVKLVTRSQIRFTTNSAKLLPSSRPLLREIANQLERCPGVVVVEGHTDGQGDREANITLSLNRARAVVSGLVGYGVPASRVRAEGFGPDRPLATNETATGRAQNRRIEFRVARTGIRGE
jgi:outer membrane protein OmpA-like peptidoglycan-associated protein